VQIYQTIEQQPTEQAECHSRFLRYLCDLLLSQMKKIVLFHRDFQRFTGGHLKVWNYFNHVLASKSFEPRIAFTPESKWDETNPWQTAKDYVTDCNPETADILFLAGKDWNAIPPNALRDFSKPIINLIQHPRHADPTDKLFGFLSNRAIRICVSEQVADAIEKTGQVNGPIFVIPNGIEVPDLRKRTGEQERPIELLMCGLKAPELARNIEQRLRQDENVAVTPLIDWMSRSEYLDRLTQARIAVTLPRPSEGFYLPALEAMACGAIVVCPDCIGNRDFCNDEVNCFRPAYDTAAIIFSIYKALALPPDEAGAMRKRAAATVQEHTLEREQATFLAILERIDDIWSG